MSGLSLTFDLIALLLALGVVANRLLRYRALRIDHVLLFTIGHAYYLSLSSVLAHLDLLGDVFTLPYEVFRSVPAGTRALASLWSLGVLGVFLTVTTVTRPARRAPAIVRPRRRFDTVGTATVLAVGALGAFLLACLAYRSVLLEGYSSSDPTQIQAQAGRGTLAALATASVLTSLYARHIVAGVELSRSRRRTADVLFALAAVLPILVLPIGGNRLYSVTLLMVIAVWSTQLRRPIRRSVLIGTGLIAFLGLTMLGSIRIRQSPSLSTLGYYATSEAGFGAWTRDLLLDSPPWLLNPLAVPRYLASDLVNVAPRAILPTKDALRLDPADGGYDIVSPLGGTNVVTSLWINFGWLGSLLVIALLAYGMRRLQWRVRAQPTSIALLTYSVAAGALGLSFFRDPFGISIVRWGLASAVITIMGLHLIGTCGAIAGRRPRLGG